MPSSSLTHTIGLSGLMASFLLVVAFLSGVERGSLTAQAEPLLEDVANYVAGYLVDAVLIPNSTQPVTLIKQIEIPNEVGGQGYTVRLELASDTWKVVARLDAIPSTYAEVALPWKASGNIRVVVEDADMGTWSKRRMLYSGTPNPIVWSQRNDSGCDVGLGSLSQSAHAWTLTDSDSQTLMDIRVVEHHRERNQLDEIRIDRGLRDRLQLDAGGIAFALRERREMRGCM